jgi:hypothetical protein
MLDSVMKNIFIEEEGVILAQRSDRSTALNHHLAMLDQWASEISFRDLVKSKRFRDSFVDLDLQLGVHRASKLHKFKVSDITARPANYVILGDPGSGKTTSLKRIASGLLHEANNPASEPPIPLLIQLRDLSPDESLCTRIAALLGFAVTYEQNFLVEFERRQTNLIPIVSKPKKPGFVTVSREPPKERTPKEELPPIAPILRRVVSQAMNALHCVLLIDGLDELRPSAREELVAELRYLLLHVSQARIILTSRTADFSYHLENSTATILQPLSGEQIQEFATRWLGAENASDFVSKVHAAPYSGSEIRPLTLAHLCAIYERIGSVPEKPRTVYRKIVHLLLEEWDQQRSIRRQSRYAGFEVDRKEEFLQALAYQITFSFRISRFTEAQLTDAYLRIHARFGLPATEAKQVAQEIESHTGLVVDVGHETYEFAHKSLQEYLTASYLVKLPQMSELLSIAPNEAALMVALSSNANEHLFSILRIAASWPSDELSKFSETFLRRIVLEHVDFIVSEQLGIYALWLYWRKYYFFGEIPADVTSSEAGREARRDFFWEFLRLPAILESTASLLRKCQVQPVVTSNYIWRVLVPAHYAALSPTQRSDFFYVDNEFLGIVQGYSEARLFGPPD